MFATVKRVGEKDENLASSFYSILLSTKLMLPLILLIKYFHLSNIFIGYPFNYRINLFIGVVFLLIYFSCKYYFIKLDNYKRIVKYYENQFFGKNKAMALIGLLYSVSTFSLFFIIANIIANT